MQITPAIEPSRFEVQVSFSDELEDGEIQIELSKEGLVLILKAVVSMESLLLLIIRMHNYGHRIIPT